jgi:putative Ca2+/H+ antiporter (TMEM165/GDT1 family)
VAATTGDSLDLFDWKVLTTTFGTIFLAEMGDKTQLAAIAAVAKTGKPGTVFLGASLALVAVTLIGVTGGEALTRVVSPATLTKLAGVSFVVIGLLILFDKI